MNGINPNFYDPLNAVKLFLSGQIAHYTVRDFTVTLQDYPYTIQEEDTMYSLAYRVFGTGNTPLWTMIAENNEIRQPEDWNPGDEILLPITILKDPSITPDTYGTATSFATPIQGFN